jgi:hypothetical protein
MAARPGIVIELSTFPFPWVICYRFNLRQVDTFPKNLSSVSVTRTLLPPQFPM